MKKVNVGDVFELDENEKLMLEEFKRNVEVAVGAFEQASRMIKTSKELFFGMIFKLRPELKDFGLTYNHSNGKITVLQKKEI